MTTNSSWAIPTAGRPGRRQKCQARALTGDDLKTFVNAKLFPYLAGFKQRASGPQTIEYKIGEVFSEITNKIQSGYNLRDVVDRIDELRFGSQVHPAECHGGFSSCVKPNGRN
ncbi:hypothetical protein [Limnohabitans sp.]|uniref:hypothetical protein n=1 Tax=Limnohabitans sp. TaxID=1907725 RepID=UPI00286F0DBB|nr:hypothetical protein [Limnohabitans sp.]